MSRLSVYLKFIKIEHTLFSLPLIFSGVYLGSKEFPSINLILLILLASVFARTAAMTLNRIIDAETDKKNPRTVTRAIPSGEISVFQAKVIVIVCLAAYFFIAYLISNTCLILSPIPIIIFIIYPYLKRFTPLAHFGVGFGLAGAPLGGWIAMGNYDLNVSPVILITIFTIFWGTGFDIIYAQLDEKSDRENNIYSMCSVYGTKIALTVSLLLHIISYIILTILYLTSFTFMFSLFFLILVGVLFTLVHIYSHNVDLAFFKLNSLISLFVFLMLVSKEF